VTSKARSGQPGSGGPSSGEPGSGLAGSDRQRWNARYGGGVAPSFLAHQLADLTLALPLPEGPVLDLASGPSGTVLLAGAAGRRAVAVDVSEVALGLLRREAADRRLSRLVVVVQADLTSWRPRAMSCALVLCTGYWDRDLFPSAAQAVRPGGLLGWEAFTTEALLVRPRMPAQWCLQPGEPASLLPGDYEILSQDDLPDDGAGQRRRMLARRGRVSRLEGPASARRPGRQYCGEAMSAWGAGHGPLEP
jgi:SAM-dependent methyltransferase